MYLKSCAVITKKRNAFPFTIPSLRQLETLTFPTNVTFFVGENGSGKSTLLEGIAWQCGFHTAGGSRNHLYDVHKSSSDMGAYLRLAWLPKITRGFFLRAETFYQFAEHLDQMESDKRYANYGGESLLDQSHGESFLTLFTQAFKGKAIYLLDEPEAALSPTRQLSLLRIMKDLEHEAQFIIATHSPILLGYPHATIYEFDETGINEVQYEETTHYIVTKQFLNARDVMLKHLFED
ncbi:ABC transporter ATP-binding protein [Lysinibacillus alkalisoli]|uniref:ABC transporter ATP-binding protein n=1 Tax=Lysinibacillus alkalisoli TaxID=1911548 RepID=A0A917LJ08_9BACI|nr:AAA family ATPase [Lysinibacillus alkalisoli]GGG31422.1 ABC transporter ATP-binding protein [Lysinibacillus alkalisoli]